MAPFPFLYSSQCSKCPSMKFGGQMRDSFTQPLFYISSIQFDLLGLYIWKYGNSEFSFSYETIKDEEEGTTH